MSIDMDDWRKFWRGGDRDAVAPVVHADYPHMPGYLYDCAACEARCHCTAGSAECVYAGYHAEFCRTCGEPSDNGEGWNGECGNCADRTYRREVVGEDTEDRHAENLRRWEANHRDGAQ